MTWAASAPSVRRPQGGLCCSDAQQTLGQPCCPQGADDMWSVAWQRLVEQGQLSMAPGSVTVSLLWSRCSLQQHAGRGLLLTTTCNRDASCRTACADSPSTQGTHRWAHLDSSHCGRPGVWCQHGPRVGVGQAGIVCLVGHHARLQHMLPANADLTRLPANLLLHVTAMSSLIP